MPRRLPARPSAARSVLKAATSGAGAPAARASRRKLAASAGEEKRARSRERSDAEEGGIRWQAAREWRIARESGVRGEPDPPDTAMRAYRSSERPGSASRREIVVEEGVPSRRRAAALGTEGSLVDEERRRRDRVLLKTGATRRRVADMVDGRGSAGVRRRWIRPAPAVERGGEGSSIYHARRRKGHRRARRWVFCRLHFAGWAGLNAVAFGGVCGPEAKLRWAGLNAERDCAIDGVWVVGWSVEVFFYFKRQCVCF